MHTNNRWTQISRGWSMPDAREFWWAKLTLLVMFGSASFLLYLHNSSMWFLLVYVVAGACFYSYVNRADLKSRPWGWLSCIGFAAYFGFLWLFITPYFLIRWSWRGGCRRWTARDMVYDLNLFNFEEAALS